MSQPCAAAQSERTRLRRLNRLEHTGPAKTPCLRKDRQQRLDNIFRHHRLAVAVGESQGMDVWDGFLKYRLCADGHRVVFDFKASDHYRWHVGIVPDIFREERIEPIAAAKEHLPIWALITTVTELVALQAVGHVVVSKAFLLRIEPGYALLSAEPKPAQSIFLNAPNGAARQAPVSV